MQFVYACRDGENEELRYSIRSVLHFFPDAEIWVIGGKPGWYIGNYIRVEQDSNKFVNVVNSIKAAIGEPGIDESFIYMNDDFYIIDKVGSFDYFYEGTLLEKYRNYTSYRATSYTKRMLDTNNKLKKLGYRNSLSYELHVPIQVEKSKLSEVIQYERLLWRSMYGNIFAVGGTPMEDVKVYTDSRMGFKDYDYRNPTSAFISSDDSSFDMIKNNLLSDMFSVKSKNEK